MAVRPAGSAAAGDDVAELVAALQAATAAAVAATAAAAAAVPVTRQITAGDGLSGGGSLAADRSLALADGGVTTAKLASGLVIDGGSL